MVAMVSITIDEQFGKFILLNNEHDLTLFKPMEQKKCINVVHDVKRISKLKLANTKFPTMIFVE